MTTIEDEDNDEDYECCLFPGEFDKINCVRIKLLLIILQGNSSYFEEKKLKQD